jgi:transposase InsO family protein
MKQIARNLTDTEDGFLLGKRYVLMDRDTKFCTAFRDVLKDAGADPLLLPPRSPNLNAYIERFMNSIKSEAISRIIFFLRREIAASCSHRFPRALSCREKSPGTRK